MADPRARVERRFRHSLRLDPPELHHEPPELRQAAVGRYLGQGERLLVALLRPEGITPLAPGEMLYRSRPFAVGPWQVEPLIHLHWQQQHDGVHLHCRAPAEAGREAQQLAAAEGGKILSLDYAYGLDVQLTGHAQSILASGCLWLQSPLLASAWCQPLSALVMRQLQRRLLERLERGLRRDFARWYTDGNLSGS